MSDGNILARLRVRETHGIRRFLYPLSAVVLENTEWPPWSKYGGPIYPLMRVADEAGNLLPSHLSRFSGHPYRPRCHIDFAISLAPYEERDLTVVATSEVPAIPDELQAQHDFTQGLTTHQERFSVNIGPESISRDERSASALAPHTALRRVVYDGVEHLAGPLEIALTTVQALPELPYRNGILERKALSARNIFGRASTPYHLKGEGFAFETRYDLTACKSWVMVRHTLRDAPAGATVTFTLPLASRDTAPTCDFGVGAGVYSKVYSQEVSWVTEFGQVPYARWQVSSLTIEGKRVDYVGATRTRAEFLGQAWFHWVERTKALAVALTDIPRICTRIKVSLSQSGSVAITFSLGARVPRDVCFGVCYHFLNDIPAIAAATNPQSILLPPTVEVLPA